MPCASTWLWLMEAGGLIGVGSLSRPCRPRQMRSPSMLFQTARASLAVMLHKPAVSVTPAAASRSRIREPTPGYCDSGRCRMAPGSSSARNMVSPAGFFMPQAVLARNRDGASPMEDRRHCPTFFKMPD